MIFSFFVCFFPSTPIYIYRKPSKNLKITKRTISFLFSLKNTNPFWYALYPLLLHIIDRKQEANEPSRQKPHLWGSTRRSETQRSVSISSFADIWSRRSHSTWQLADYFIDRKLLTTFTLKYASALLKKKTQWTQWIQSLYGWAAATFLLVLSIAFSPFPFLYLRHLWKQPSLTFKPLASVTKSQAWEPNCSKPSELRQGFFQVWKHQLCLSSWFPSKSRSISFHVLYSSFAHFHTFFCSLVQQESL